ncbi:MAG: hypothetical protein HYY00_04910 [Chloroflexi bacterium]|nr:hypothetical protein [Chloroflexota bacterium]
MQQEIGRGLLVVTADVDPENEVEFNRWYNEEHVPERLTVPGFLGARRFVAVEGQPKYIAIYEMESPEVLRSEFYRKLRDNPTEWTGRVLARARTNRVVYRQLFPAQGAFTDRSGPAAHRGP